MVPDQINVTVDTARYVLTHLHLTRCWGRELPQELEWFLKSLRGELPASQRAARNYQIYHVNLPPAQYFLALETLTTRLGVGLEQEAKP